MEKIALSLSKNYNGSIKIFKGEELKKNFPAIHTVGRAAEEVPRFIDLRWNKNSDFPLVTIIGKGSLLTVEALILNPPMLWK